MQPDYDTYLQSYFTDMEPLRGLFKDFISAQTLPKRLIVLHGVGGVGKSSLLRMFRLDCKNDNIPVALASGDEAKSVLDVITRWMEDLKLDGIKLLTLGKTLESYRLIQLKVADQVKKSQTASNRMADIAGKAASKTAEAAGGALLGAAIGSVVPGLGTTIGGALGGVVGGMGAEALTDWLRGFLSKPDIDLLLDPAKKLSTDFLEDLGKAAEKKRIVLLLDTFEQMSALEDWVGEIAQKIHPNVLMVIAGRKLPDWGRSWSGWMAFAQVEELKPMSAEIMRELIRRYYATMRGGEPDPAQVEAIIHFARGLPMVVTSAVQLWVKYGVEDFQSVKAEIVANLVDRLMEGVPPALIPALEAAAVVRWFDQPILRAVMQQDNTRDVYNELRRFPFTRTRAEGLALHDSVREILDENLRVQDSERHHELHERAAKYFEKRLEKATGGETERLGLERLYHRICVYEEIGINLFQEMAEELVRYRFINRLRVLLNDVNTYTLERENNKSWREYYYARLAHLEIKFTDAGKVYEKLGTTNTEPKLKAYALCDWGEVLARYELLGQEKAMMKAIKILEESLNLIKLDYHLTKSLFALARIARYQGKWNQQNEYLEKARKFFDEQKDNYGLAHTYSEMKRVSGRLGKWKELFTTHNKGIDTLSLVTPQPLMLNAILFGQNAHSWSLAGYYLAGEQLARKAVEIAQVLRDDYLIQKFLCEYGITLGIQNKFTQAIQSFEESLTINDHLEDIQKIGRGSKLAFLGAILSRKGDFQEGKRLLLEGLKIKETLQDIPGIQEPLLWLSLATESFSELEEANYYYNRCLEWKWYGRYYFDCAALTGLIRVKHALGDLATIPPLLAEAEGLAQQYEYNDHLASLRLTQGHLRAEGHAETSEVLKTSEVWSDSPLDYYKQAMIYALRYNRFLLDELLSGRPQGTPLRPIIPSLLERGEEGRAMLIALRDWWQTGFNDIGTPRSDTISPIPEGIRLIEAEKLAREREPGDGSVQKSVIEQFAIV